MAYTKPQVVAQNSASGSYAAGCPANTNSMASTLKAPEKLNYQNTLQ